MIAKRSFCLLSTRSAARHPHAAGVIYELVGDATYINTMRSSRKGKNASTHDRVGVCIPVRRLPVGPPSTILFQADVEILDLDDAEIIRLVGAGHLGSITGHGELDIEDGCFLKITLPPTLFTFGLGKSLLTFIKDPLNAAGVVLRG